MSVINAWTNIYASGEPHMPQVDRVRNNFDAVLSKTIDTFRGRVHAVLIERLDGMRAVFLRYLVERVFTTALSSDEVDGTVFVMWQVLRHVYQQSFSEDNFGSLFRGTTVMDCVFAVMSELHRFFMVAGIRQVQRTLPFNDLPDHLRDLILEKADGMDVDAALIYANGIASRVFNSTFVHEYYGYRFLTKRVAALLGASELNARMPPNGDDWWGLLRFYMEFKLMCYVCREDAGTPCAPPSSDAVCVSCRKAYIMGYKRMFVRFHNAFCSMKKRTPVNGVYNFDFIRDAEKGFVKRYCTMRAHSWLRGV